MGKKLKEKKAILFWIKSSRGTDDLAVYLFDSDISKAEIKDKLEKWCSYHGAWEKSENVVSYGYEIVSIPPREVLTEIYDKACEEKTKAVDCWKRWAAFMMAKEWGT